MENNMEEKNHIYPKTVGALHSGRGALYYSVLRFGEHDCDGDYWLDVNIGILYHLTLRPAGVSCGSCLFVAVLSV